jgi:hypothetical protein
VYNGRYHWRKRMSSEAHLSFSFIDCNDKAMKKHIYDAIRSPVINLISGVWNVYNSVEDIDYRVF